MQLCNCIFYFFDSCQFVVIEGGDYSLYWTNPDVLVDWNLVEQIVSCYNSLIINLLITRDLATYYHTPRTNTG